MLRDCLRVFEKELENRTERWLLDNYEPKKGTYILINMDKDFLVEECIDIAQDKKTGETIGRTHKDYRFIQFLDYHSKLMEMNKPMDPKKTIHSNNLYTFFLKKESIAEKKLTNEVIEGYYQTILHPAQKYTKPKANVLYRKIEEEIGPVDACAAEKIREWINNWREHPDILQDVDMTKKEYIKFFFVYEDREKTERLYKQENRRYLLPNIYNSNDYNREVNGQTVGLPGNNMGMNSKKPYLANKSRKVEVPDLESLDEVVLKGKFFDYLWGQASAGKVNIYVDYENNRIMSYGNNEAADVLDNGGFIRIRKEKNEAEIQCMDTIVGYSPNLKRGFEYKNILDLKPEQQAEVSAGYGWKPTLFDLNLLFDEVFFGKKLIYNYFNEPADITFKDRQLENILLTYRGRLFDWFYKGADTYMKEITEEMSMRLILHSMENGYWNKIKHQMNLMWSLQDYFAGDGRMEETVRMVKQNLKKHLDMYQEEWDFENDEEYYYALGQLVNYFLSLSKAKKTPLSMINAFLNAENNEVVKEKVIQMFQKYSYGIDSRKDARVKNLISHIMLYEPKGKVLKDMMIAGVTGSRIIFEAKEEKGGVA